MINTLLILATVEDIVTNPPGWANALIALFLSLGGTAFIQALFKASISALVTKSKKAIDDLTAENKITVEESAKAKAFLSQSEVKLLEKVDELHTTVTEQGGVIKEFVDTARSQTALVDKVLDFIEEYDTDIAVAATVFIDEMVTEETNGGA